MYSTKKRHFERIITLHKILNEQTCINVSKIDLFCSGCRCELVNLCHKSRRLFPMCMGNLIQFLTNATGWC